MKGKINKYGQFFTKKELCKVIVENINSYKELSGKILEPSFGSGNFIDILKEYNLNIDAVEIDSEHFTSYISSDINLFNDDFLNFKGSGYDFIIGNPPYVELCYSFYDKPTQEKIKKENKGISNGRINLVHLFFKKSFEIINNDGIIAYLLPSAVLTSPTYKNIRKIIYENFIVENIVEDVKFEGVAIKVSLIIIRKSTNKNNKYFYLDNDNYFLMENYENFSNKSKTLKDYNFDVSIGEIVWNQHKDLLSDDNKDNILVYSSNIESGNIQFEKNRGRKQYIKYDKIKYDTCIIFPRTISKNIKYFYVKENKNMIFENHVLVLTNKDPLLLNQFYQKLEDKDYKEKMLSFFNSSNLTKGELLSLPF